MNSKRPAAAAASTAKASGSAGQAARPGKSAADALADQELDKVSGGPTAVERKPPMT